MTPSEHDAPATYQGMIDWLDGELRQLKAQVREQADNLEQTRSIVWDLQEQTRRAEGGAINLAAQIDALSSLGEEVRLQRERLERLQGIVGQEQQQMEQVARQIRAEMQAERDERGELRRQAEFVDQTMATVGEKVTLLEDIGRRLQDAQALVEQRLEQEAISLHAIDARVAANAEAVRRSQGDVRNITGDIERLGRALEETNERQSRTLEVTRRLQDRADRSQELDEEFEAAKERLDVMRQSHDQVVERANTLARELEAAAARVGEMERGQDRLRNRAEQHDRQVLELQHKVDDVHEFAIKEAEGFLTFQEKARRRQIQDLEQEIRDIKAQVRANADS